MARTRDRFRTIERFSIHYGAGDLEKLSQFEVVVLEPGHRTPQEIKSLKDSGVIVLAYVSVMEVHEEHPLRQFVTESDYLRAQEPPYTYIMQEAYGNRIVSLTSVNWRGCLLRHVGELLVRAGYDGIFLDTIGDVEMTAIRQNMQQVEAAAILVKQMRSWFPEAVLVQNNGLELLCQYTATYVDAIVWENPPLDLPESRDWVEAVAERLSVLAIQDSVRILVLFEGARQENRLHFLRGRAFAQKHGFTPYFAPEHYLELR